MAIERQRIRALNSAPEREGAKFVLYWAQANRRVDFNHALAHAAQLANERGLPLFVYEEFTSANQRMRDFVQDAVPDTAKQLAKMRAGYHFSLTHDVERFTAEARCIVTDDHPLCPVQQFDVAAFAADSSCIVPMSVHEKRAYGAYTIRPKIKRELPTYLKLVDVPALKNRWREPASEYAGRGNRAPWYLERFLEERLRRYSADGNQPSKHANSELSPYLHFGHISSLEVALAVRRHAEENKLMADEFLEQLIVRRELAFNFARFTPALDSLECLPDWCRRTMAKHANDPRPFVYTAAQFESAATHDALWNATQRELLLRGTIHGYYRMYWGKKIIEWSPTYKEALATMIHLHDVYALDGRDPNTYTNILWCFGLHDRPWGERPVFGQLRCISLEGMRRKTKVDEYIKETNQL